MCRLIGDALQVVQVSFGAQCQAAFQESRAQPPGNAFQVRCDAQGLGGRASLPNKVAEEQPARGPS
jgi:hypothetical protein